MALVPPCRVPECNKQLSAQCLSRELSPVLVHLEGSFSFVVHTHRLIRPLKMGGGGDIVITGTTETSRIEAPVTLRAYLICAFAAFGGIFFGYDTGWMSGVLGMK